MHACSQREETKLSGLFREEPPGEGQHRPWAGKFRLVGRVGKVETEGCWENLESRSALICRICTSVPSPRVLNIFCLPHCPTEGARKQVRQAIPSMILLDLLFQPWNVPGCIGIRVLKNLAPLGIGTLGKSWQKLPVILGNLLYVSFAYPLSPSRNPEICHCRGLNRQIFSGHIGL